MAKRTVVQEVEDDVYDGPPIDIGDISITYEGQLLGPGMVSPITNAMAESITKAINFEVDRVEAIEVGLVQAREDAVRAALTQ